MKIIFKKDGEEKTTSFEEVILVLLRCPFCNYEHKYYQVSYYELNLGTECTRCQAKILWI